LNLKPEDQPLLRFMLGGKKMRPRKVPYRDRHVETPIDPAELDPYELLIYERAPELNRAAHAALVWDWGAVFTLEEARAWFAAGASVHDLETPRKFKDAGVPPELAGAQVYVRDRALNDTFFARVRDRIMTAEDVYRAAVAAGKLPGPDGGVTEGSASGDG
jgi:hypothetical protein